MPKSTPTYEGFDRGGNYRGKPTIPPGVRASLADCGTSNLKYHVVEFRSGMWLAVCGSDHTSAGEMSTHTVLAAELKPEFCCRKPACRKAFDAARAATGTTSKGEAS